MEISYCALKQKEVVNISDGKNFGNLTDMIFDINCGKILGIIVSNSKNFFNIFKANNDIFIPYNRICKIGKDIIIVDIGQPNNCAIQNIETNNKIYNNKKIINENKNNNTQQ